MSVQVESDVSGTIDAQRMWRDLEALCRLDRTSGSYGERRAMEYIAAGLRDAGIGVQVYEFDAYLSYPIAGGITVVSGEGLPPTIAARTRAFSANTPPEGTSGEVIYVPGGHDIFRDTETHRRLEAAAIAGKIVLSEAGSRRNMQAAQARGAVAYIHMWPSEEDAFHEGIVSPVWGAPTPQTAAAFPRIPIVSVTRASGEAIRAAIGRGPVRVAVHSRTDTGWRSVVLPVASIPGRTPEYILFSGHVDSWYLGATDNATGNVVTMEVARVLHAHREHLLRGVRFGFWPGHSTGRYAGSSWYADRHWQDLYDHCVLHINCDSPGVQGATEYDPVTASAEASAFAVDLVRELTGQAVGWERPVRAGDQSFWGTGVPSLFMGLSVRPKGQRWAVGGSGLAWWWHTEADTIDKVDPEVLLLDTRIYLTATYRMATAPVLPFRLGAAVAELEDALAALDRDAAGRFDLEPVRAALRRVAAAADAFDAVAGGLRRDAGGEESQGHLAVVNAAQRRAVRELVQAAYVAEGPWDHDPAVPQRPLPALAEARELAHLAPETHDARMLHVRLVRQRNRVVWNLTRAAEALEAAMAELAVQ
ncbi:MAG: M28 family peptidase [Armatimonadota bacterium]|nr:M28 family peptidase [Armatimonadota bacterium]